jgi:hypothetical protein
MIALRLAAGAIKQSDRTIPLSDTIAARQQNKWGGRALGAWHETTRTEECHEDRNRWIGLHVRDLDRRYLGLKSLQQEHAIGRRGAIGTSS